MKKLLSKILCGSLAVILLSINISPLIAEARNRIQSEEWTNDFNLPNDFNDNSDKKFYYNNSINGLNFCEGNGRKVGLKLGAELETLYEVHVSDHTESREAAPVYHYKSEIEYDSVLPSGSYMFNILSNHSDISDDVYMQRLSNPFDLIKDNFEFEEADGLDNMNNYLSKHPYINNTKKFPEEFKPYSDTFSLVNYSYTTSTSGDFCILYLIWFDSETLKYYYYSFAMTRDDQENDVFHLGLYSSDVYYIIKWADYFSQLSLGDIGQNAFQAALQKLFKADSTEAEKDRADEFLRKNFGVFIDSTDEKNIKYEIFMGFDVAEIAVSWDDNMNSTRLYDNDTGRIFSRSTTDYLYRAHFDPSADKVHMDQMLVVVPWDTIMGTYELGSEEVNWDMESSKFGFESNNLNPTGVIVNDLIEYFAVDICKNIQDQEDLENVSIDTEIDNISDSEVVRAILKSYKEQLKECIRGLKLEDWEDLYTQGDDLYMSYSKPIDVLTAVCRNSIAAMDPDGSIKFNTGYYNLSFTNSQLYINTNTKSKGNDAEIKAEYLIDVISLNDLYEQCSSLEKRQLILSYQFAFNNYELHTSKKNINTSSKISDFLNVGIPSYTGTYTPIEIEGQSLQDYVANKVNSVNAVAADGTILSYLKYTDSIGLYTVYQCLFGLSSEDDTDIYNVYNSELDIAMRKNYLYQSNEFYFPDKMISGFGKWNDILNYGLSGNCILTEDSVPDAHYYLLKHLYITAYGFTICNGNSQYAREEGYSAYSVGKSFGLSDTELNGLKNDKDKSFPTTDNYKEGTFSPEGNGMLQAIISLYDFCNVMGIGENDWTEDIGDYLHLCKILESKGILEQLRENKNIFTPHEKGSYSEDEPMGMFFNLSSKSLSDQWIKGFALSSTYSPMNTNIYDSMPAEFLGDVEWVSEFYYKYGFYRKALYINTDSSAIVNKFISGTESSTKVATLRDLLEYNRDIVLTVDDNFYNARQVEDILSKLDYASVRNNNQGTSQETGAVQDVFLNIKELFVLDAGIVLKTGSNKYYSSELYQDVTPLGKDETESKNSYDAYLLMKKDIEEALQAQEYSVMQPMAVVSAIYKSEALFNQMLKCTSVDNAIFKSSKAIVATPGTKQSDWLAMYNYYMLANLAEQMKNDSSSTLDLDAPIFCDIFGNIVTESGLVIIPAASNATLCGPNWTPMSVGWADLYYNGNMIQYEDLSLNVLEFLTGSMWIEKEDGSREMKVQAGSIVKQSPCGGGWFSVDGKVMQIRTSEVHSAGNSAVIQWSNLSKNSDKIKQIFYNHNYYEVGPNLFNYTTTNMITEVMRGAPIESIDYTYEGLNTLKDATRFGVTMAYALEHVSDTVLNTSDGNFSVGNSITTLPNLAFMEGIEYVVLFAFKIAFALGICGLAINLYLEAVQNQLGIKSAFKFFGSLILVLLAVLVLPQVLNWSYYRSNKALLTDDIMYVQMLDYTKEFDGAEINVTTISTPESTTELYLKLDDISLDWWDVLYEVLFENTAKTVTELYENQLADNSYYGADGVVIKSDGVYLSIDDLFNSTSITYLPASNTIVNYTYQDSDNLVASFVTPYYYFLDQLVANVNQYNTEQAVQAYSYGIGQNGHLYTYELSAPYFKSKKFMEEGYDVLNLHYIFDTSSGAVPMNKVVDSRDVDLMHYSLWWPSDKMTSDDMYAKIDSLYTYARDYIANNVDIIGKVPDEVFLKTFALQLAIKWNNMFNVPMANSVEIMNVDTRDIMRLIAGSKADVYKYNSYGIARFIYEEGGVGGCFVAALFLGVVWVSNIFKSVTMLIIIALLCFNVLLRRTIYRGEGNKCIEGYIITCGLMAACNLLYSFMLKLCLTVSDYGMGTTSSFCFALVVQILYLAALLGILMVVVKDWEHSGLGEWQNISASLSHTMNDKFSSFANRFLRNGSSNNRSRATSGLEENSIEAMMERQQDYENQFLD